MAVTYLFSPGETETGKAFRKELCSRIGKVTEVSTVEPNNVPLVVIVQNFSRIGTDIESVVTDLPDGIDKSKVAILVLHVTAKHALPSLTPTSTLTDDKYEEYGCMVDFFFTQDVGIYGCRLNDEATHKLKGFLNVREPHKKESYNSIPEERQPSQVGSWSHGLCNCFGDFRTCIIAFIVPCVRFGQTADAIGEGDCVKCGLVSMVPILNLITWVGIRGKIREMRGIQGSTINDCLIIMCCPLCALVQEAREVGGYAPPVAQSMSRE